MEMEKKRKGKRFWEYKIEIQLDVNEGKEGKSNMREMSFFFFALRLNERVHGRNYFSVLG